MAKHFRRAIKYLIVIIIIFFLIFMYSFFSYKTGRSIIGTKLSSEAESLIVMALSVFAMIRAVFSVHRH